MALWKCMSAQLAELRKRPWLLGQLSETNATTPNITMALDFALEPPPRVHTRLGRKW
jgi:hypothetical protein